jgi:hypothetical protein
MQPSGQRAIIRSDGQADPRYAWLATNDKARQGVLTELGRIARQYGEERARMMADLIAEMAAAGAISTTREAEVFLREARLRKPISETVSERPQCNGRAQQAIGERPLARRPEPAPAAAR